MNKQRELKLYEVKPLSCFIRVKNSDFYAHFSHQNHDGDCVYKFLNTIIGATLFTKNNADEFMQTVRITSSDFENVEFERIPFIDVIDEETYTERLTLLN